MIEFTGINTVFGSEAIALYQSVMLKVWLFTRGLWLLWGSVGSNGCCPETEQ
ncbi:hypothetical protein [Nodularia sp. UHCC 0506]|uniref:hypothetical protein n=1 Tax=Nodularia sp. UHCC 0506 TaxID=3110243 RepID=UPI002B201A25|nr:hypothetical protein [Nodularia sp. UHCC 0506]MEA5516303.1 hypothetical protein [Nodularia sp. UHCC 0506]